MFPENPNTGDVYTLPTTGQVFIWQDDHWYARSQNGTGESIRQEIKIIESNNSTITLSQTPNANYPTWVTLNGLHLMSNDNDYSVVGNSIIINAAHDVTTGDAVIVSYYV